MVYKIVKAVATLSLVLNFAGLGGHAMAQSSITNTGPGSTNEITNTSTNTTTIDCTNDLTLSGSNTQTSGSGSSSVSGNTSGGSATSGSTSNTSSTSTSININGCPQAQTTSSTQPGGKGGEVTSAPSGGGAGVGVTPTVLPETGGPTPIKYVGIGSVVLAGAAGLTQFVVAGYRRRLFE